MSLEYYFMAYLLYFRRYLCKDTETIVRKSGTNRNLSAKIVIPMMRK